MFDSYDHEPSPDRAEQEAEFDRVTRRWWDETLDDRAAAMGEIGRYSRAVNRFHAGQLRMNPAVLARAVANRDADTTEDEAMLSAESEIVLELGFASLDAGESWVLLARNLTERLPRLLDALEEGLIDVAVAKMLVEETINLDVAAARRVIDDLWDKMADRSRESLKGMARRRVIRVDPLASIQRARAARAERRVLLQPHNDGTATLTAVLCAEDAVAVYAYIDTLARHLLPDDRPIAALRADALVDAILRPGAQKAVKVDLRIDRINGVPELEGFGPIDEEIVREMPDRYEPTAGVKRKVQDRDRHCRFPGCRRPAKQCQLDHVIRFRVGGRTIVINLSALCQHHHRLKHLIGWDVVQDPDGTQTRTTPTGREIVTKPWRLDDPAPEQNPGPEVVPF